MSTTFKLIFYVPKTSVEKVKSAVFATGAGHLGNYSHCSFETEGVGQFKPLKDANPSLGSVGEIERVEELKVELICREDVLKNAIVALKKSHPYEEVAFEVIRLENFANP